MLSKAIAGMGEGAGRPVYSPSSHVNRLTLRGGYIEGAAGLARSQMQRSPSAAPDANRLGLKLLNSRPLT